MRRAYDVHGMTLEIAGDDDAPIDVLDVYLAPFLTEPRSAPGYTVEIVRGVVAARPEGELIYDGELLPAVAAQVLQAVDGRWYWLPNRLSIWLGGRCRARMTVDPGCDRDVLTYAAIHVLDAAFKMNGQFLIHGAALVMPGDEPRALLLLAPSGRGKTTTALALALSGYALMTDDAIIAGCPQNGEGKTCYAWGLPRALKVHHETARLLPAIAPLLGAVWDQNGEQVLTGDVLARVATVVPARRFTVGAVGVLGPRTADAHLIVPLAKSAALQALAEDNVFHAPSGVPSDQLARFEALSVLVRNMPTFEIRVGPNLSTLAAALSPTLAVGS